MSNGERDHEWHWTEGNRYAIEGIKTLLLLNGGAAISLMAFLGGRTTAPRSIDIAHAAGNSLLTFCMGALAASLVFFFAYLTQLQYGNRNFYPALVLHLACYLMFAISVALFVAGVYFARLAIIANLTS
jgi:hypothetical protein